MLEFCDKAHSRSRLYSSNIFQFSRADSIVGKNLNGGVSIFSEGESKTCLHISIRFDGYQQFSEYTGVGWFPGGVWWSGEYLLNISLARLGILVMDSW